jgi:hypothetical protein
MRRSLLFTCLLAACGDGGGPTSVPTGTWRLVGDSSAPAATLNGALELGDTGYALGIAQPAPEGLVTSYTIADGAFELEGAGRVPFTLEGDRLTLRPPGGRELAFARVTPAPAETLAITGAVTLAPGAPADDLHVALVRRVRSASGFLFDARDDRPLSFEGGRATFDLTNDRLGLGTDRIPFGNAFIGLLLTVVYQDRDQDGRLDELATCTAATVDCIVGVSPVLVAIRQNSSPELDRTSYALLREGASHAVAVADARNGALGVASVDPQVDAAHDVGVGADPSQVVLPAFDLTLR